MGNEVLKTAEERGEEKGIFKSKLEDIKNAMENGNLTFDKVCDLLGITNREQYRKHI